MADFIIPDQYKPETGGGSGGGAVDSVNGRTGAVTLSKGDVSLLNVDNTSDLDKPISSAVASALTNKLSTGLSTGKILVGNASNLAAQVTMSGDVTIDSTGLTTIKSSVALAGSPTTTTAPENDDSTKIATTAYALRAVNSISGVKNPFVWYIDPLVGDDANIGSVLKPKKTFNAITTLLSSSIIFFGAGEITSPIVLTNLMSDITLIGNGGNSSFATVFDAQIILLDPSLVTIKYMSFRATATSTYEEYITGIANGYLNVSNCLFDNLSSTTLLRTATYNPNLTSDEIIIKHDNCRFATDPAGSEIKLVERSAGSQPKIIFDNNFESEGDLYENINNSWVIEDHAKITSTADQIALTFSNAYTVNIDGATETNAGALTARDYNKLLYLGSIADVGNPGANIYEFYFDASGKFIIPPFIRNILIYSSNANQIIQLPNFENDPSQSSADHNGDAITITIAASSSFGIKVITGTSRQIIKSNDTIVNEYPFLSAEGLVLRWDDSTKIWEQAN
jgi:hypothetical protein